MMQINPMALLYIELITDFLNLIQLIEAPNKTMGFADSISVDDGMSIAIGASYDDEINADPRISLYLQTSGRKVYLDQTLYSPKNERASTVWNNSIHTGDVLAIGSKNADSMFESTIDAYSLKKTDPKLYKNDPSAPSIQILLHLITVLQNLERQM